MFIRVGTQFNEFEICRSTTYCRFKFEPPKKDLYRQINEFELNC